MTSKRFSLLPRPEDAATARREAARWLQQMGLNGDDVDQLSLIVSELLSNAVEASPGDEPVELTMTAEGDTYTVAVVNAALAEPDGLLAVADATAERGRGLAIVRDLADSFQLSYRRGRASATAVKRLAFSGPYQFSEWKTSP